MSNVATIEGPAVNVGNAERDKMIKLPADIAERLTPEQAERVQAMLSSRIAVHPIDYRVTTSLFGRRFYVALFAGNEARTWQRLKDENQIRPFLAVLRDGAVFTFGVTIALCALVMAAILGMYVLKWTTGIDYLLLP